MTTLPNPAEAPGRRDDLVCPDCGAAMKLRVSARFTCPFFYGCSAFPRCRATHGAHPDGKPLGVPAGRVIKDARIRAHAAFDPLWKDGHMRRSQAYGWLARAMGLVEAHMGEFTVEQCDLAVKLCAEKTAEIKRTPPALLELREQVRETFRSWGKGRGREARDWAAQALGLAAWAGTDALSTEQLHALLAANVERARSPVRLSARPPLEEALRRRSEVVLRRLDGAEIALLQSFSHGPRLPFRKERPRMNRLGYNGFCLVVHVTDCDDVVFAYQLTELGQYVLRLAATLLTPKESVLS